MSKVAAVVVGGGLSQRMGRDKILMSLGGKPVIAWSMDVLQKCGSVDSIVLVLHKDIISAGRKLVSNSRWSKLNTICEGGERRQDSVKNGLAAVSHCDYVLIHDGARPFITEKLINDGLKAVEETGAAVAAVDVKDTIKQVDDSGIVRKTLQRDAHKAVQTPQVFRFDLINKSYEIAGGEFTDDAAVAERAGYRVKLYQGDYENIKITTPEDMLMAEIIARGRQ